MFCVFTRRKFGPSSKLCVQRNRLQLVGGTGVRLLVNHKEQFKRHRNLHSKFIILDDSDDRRRKTGLVDDNRASSQWLNIMVIWYINLIQYSNELSGIDSTIELRNMANFSGWLIHEWGSTGVFPVTANTKKINRFQIKIKVRSVDWNCLTNTGHY